MHIKKYKDSKIWYDISTDWSDGNLVNFLSMWQIWKFEKEQGRQKNIELWFVVYLFLGMCELDYWALITNPHPIHIVGGEVFKTIDYADFYMVHCYFGIVGIY